MRETSMALALAWLTGCGGGEAVPESPADSSGQPADSTAPTEFETQVAMGQTLFANHCATCHGPRGEGGEGPRLVGLDQGALPLEPPVQAKHRDSRFVTVADVAAFVVENMPPNAPGSLTEEQYFSILAFNLYANGIDLDQKLDASLAATLTIPRALPN